MQKILDTDQFKIVQEIYARKSGADSPLEIEINNQKCYLWDLMLYTKPWVGEWIEPDPLEQDPGIERRKTAPEEFEWCLSYYLQEDACKDNPGEYLVEKYDGVLKQMVLPYDSHIPYEILKAAREKWPEVTEKELYDEWGVEWLD